MIVEFIEANKVAIGECFGGLVTFCTALNRIIPADKGPKWMHLFLDRVGASAKPNMDGTIGPVTIPLITKSKTRPLASTETVNADDKK